MRIFTCMHIHLCGSAVGIQNRDMMVVCVCLVASSSFSPFPPVYPGNRQTRLYQPQDAGLRGMPNFRILTAAAA